MKAPIELLMVIVSVESESGYGCWMNGYLPDGDEASSYLRRRARGPPEQYAHLRGRGRHDNELRAAYRALLSEAYQAFQESDDNYHLLLLGDGPGAGHSLPLLDALGCPDQDHLVLVREEPIGEEFFLSVQRDYGWISADLENDEALSGVRTWNDKGEPIQLPNSNQVFALAVRTILYPYIDMICAPEFAGQRYFERWNIRTD